MAMPNFLILGAQKCGTTTVYELMRQHPEIYMSRDKEPHFFAFEDEKIKFNGPRVANLSPYWRSRSTKLKDYQALFSEIKDEKAYGEASPLYLYVPKACERIAHYIPNAKLIILLRNPADRAYSNFCHSVRCGFEPFLNFEKTIEAEEKRMQKKWGSEWYYKHLGLYYAQVKRYYDRFDHKQIKIYLFEDFVQNPITIIQDMYSFLGVDNSFIPVLSVENANTGIPYNNLRNRLLQAAVGQVARGSLLSELFRKLQTLDKISKPLPDTRKELIHYFKSDILQLEKLINRDLSCWFETSVKNG